MSAKINHREILHQGRVYRLVQENVTLETGVTTDIEFVEHPGATAIVALQDNGEVILIKQYRHSLRQNIWEIPAGTLNPDESILECARRELAEETGYSAEQWQKLAEMTPVPGYSDERIHVYLARRLKPVKQNLDEDEIIKVHPFTFAKAFEMIENGDIQDSKSISALFIAHKWIGKRDSNVN